MGKHGGGVRDVVVIGKGKAADLTTKIIGPRLAVEHGDTIGQKRAGCGIEADLLAVLDLPALNIGPAVVIDIADVAAARAIAAG